MKWIKSETNDILYFRCEAWIEQVKQGFLYYSEDGLKVFNANYAGTDQNQRPASSYTLEVKLRSSFFLNNPSVISLSHISNWNLLLLITKDIGRGGDFPLFPLISNLLVFAPLRAQRSWVTLGTEEHKPSLHSILSLVGQRDEIACQLRRVCPLFLLSGRCTEGNNEQSMAEYERYDCRLQRRERWTRREGNSRGTERIDADQETWE